MFEVISESVIKGSYIWFVKGESPGKKTNIYQVQSRVGESFIVIGFIKWHGPWRKYCYFPQPETIYDKGCMREIANFCDDETEKHMWVRASTST
jgi:hypothetical protein